MELGCRVVQRLATHLEQRLTLGQKLIIRQTLLQSRLDLIREIYGEEYKPAAECSGCGRQMNPLEIIMGFRDDPQDYTTECTNCHLRFKPSLRWRSDYSSGEVPFFCAVQVLDQIRDLREKTSEEIEKEYPAIFHSVRVHYGNLRRAFEKIGIEYEHHFVANWKERIADFLGKLPDTVIAEAVDIPVADIRRLRKGKNIRAFRERNILDINDDTEDMELEDV